MGESCPLSPPRQGGRKACRRPSGHAGPHHTLEVGTLPWSTPRADPELSHVMRDAHRKRKAAGLATLDRAWK
jgi:hypothetical protein